MLQDKLHTLMRTQFIVALLFVLLFWGAGKADIAYAIAFVSALLLLNGLSLGAGVMLASERSPLEALSALYIRAAIRFVVSIALLVAGFYYLKLNIFGVLFSAALYYAIPIVSIGCEAVMLKRKQEEKQSPIRKAGDGNVGS